MGNFLEDFGLNFTERVGGSWVSLALIFDICWGLIRFVEVDLTRWNVYFFENLVIILGVFILVSGRFLKRFLLLGPVVLIGGWFISFEYTVILSLRELVLLTSRK